jgi:hypothetical protein
MQKGFVRRRVKEIENAIREARCIQPPSLYKSVTTPLEVWAIPDLSTSTSQTIFYKVPQAQECESIFELSNVDFDMEEVLMTMKAEPRMIRLLENAGIALPQNKRMPPPPTVCEEWWAQSEDFVKRRGKTQHKFGLGYRNKGVSDHGKEEDPEDGTYIVSPQRQLQVMRQGAHTKPHTNNTSQR